ncbi:hypothetical protein CROQUDRAFT_103506 [Cronartium quercuum f. sp. fusiforme G11]|uniref:Uncharacterized protein n=1 Tax=Cronartium quercuum f. sp. fusiforme G11 TaxID=708437 RepID=A0A9P6NT52_9BASI|nr:hypothetical protein CROQUDRAFT_103506 [Cronartium quercuum f. sp. fusiforme G11]
MLIGTRGLGGTEHSKGSSKLEARLFELNSFEGDRGLAMMTAITRWTHLRKNRSLFERNSDRLSCVPQLEPERMRIDEWAMAKMSSEDPKSAPIRQSFSKARQRMEDESLNALRLTDLIKHDTYHPGPDVGDPSPCFQKETRPASIEIGSRVISPTPLSLLAQITPTSHTGASRQRRSSRATSTSPIAKFDQSRNQSSLPDPLSHLDFTQVGRLDVAIRPRFRAKPAPSIKVTLSSSRSAEHPTSVRAHPNSSSSLADEANQAVTEDEVIELLKSKGGQIGLAVLFAHFSTRLTDTPTRSSFFCIVRKLAEADRVTNQLKLREPNGPEIAPFVLMTEEEVTDILQIHSYTSREICYQFKSRLRDD